ncbi:hypothetical protein BC832DRAFT_563283 [Gaertneriomyces semiglobifer]|nr:hypothetical protein BC832DRAFT_563283 [Gaertneriomyces semiglobifer]
MSMSKHQLERLVDVVEMDFQRNISSVLSLVLDEGDRYLNMGLAYGQEDYAQFERITREPLQQRKIHPKQFSIRSLWDLAQSVP